MSERPARVNTTNSFTIRLGLRAQPPIRKEVAHMTTTQQHTTNTGSADEATGTIWIDFGDGGSARWAGLSLSTLDQVCAQLETVKPADTIT